MELSELKEQNAKEEAEALASSTKPEETEFEEAGEDLEEGKDVVEPWMQEEETEEQTSDDPSKSVPVGKFVSLKKELRGKIEDRDKELEKLRSENEALRLATPKSEKVLKRPDANDFDTDEEYELAASRYDEERLQDTYNRNRKKEQETEAIRQAQAAIDKAMDSHYEQAEELIKTSGIAKEKYVAASNNTKSVFKELFKDGGNVVFENMFAKLGKGSEKLEYFIGVNRAAQEKVKSLIKEDPLGLSLAMWLGQEKQRLTNPIKPRSNAPDPTASLKGDEAATVSPSKYKKKYDAAGPGTQAAYEAKKAARKAGVDTSKW